MGDRRKQSSGSSKCRWLGHLGMSAAMCVAVASHSVSGSDWQTLFNGRNFDGWQMKFAGSPVGENYKDTFLVENGVIRVSYDNYEKFSGEFGHLFYKVPYENYRLRFDYRFLGEQTPGGPRWAFRNSGVMVHSQSAESMTIEQEFPVSIEVQLLGQTGEKVRPTGNVCTPGTHIVLSGKLEKEHCIRSSSKTFAGDGWVNAEVEVRGGTSIKHYINGELVLEYAAPQLDPSEVDTKRIMKGQDKLLTGGYIAFQAESHPAEFRNIQIQLIEE